MTGRQPISPIDAMIARTLSHTEHVERLKVISAELKNLAPEKQLPQQDCKSKTRFEKGNFILKINETQRDSLNPKFNGPYKVVDVRGTGIKVQKRNIRESIHASRCKRLYEGGDIPLIMSMTNQSTTVELSAPG